ncbi:MAG: hypothetical protein FJ134_01760 [Deltaproteobacteria bacterium]|nr:hypothetical protein [Deltaproteobacteria bacterium]
MSTGTPEAGSSANRVEPVKLHPRYFAKTPPPGPRKAKGPANRKFPANYFYHKGWFPLAAALLTSEKFAELSASHKAQFFLYASEWNRRQAKGYLMPDERMAAALDVDKKTIRRGRKLLKAAGLVDYEPGCEKVKRFATLITHVNLPREQPFVKIYREELIGLLTIPQVKHRHIVAFCSLCLLRYIGKQGLITGCLSIDKGELVALSGEPEAPALVVELEQILEHLYVFRVKKRYGKLLVAAWGCLSGGDS